MNAIELVRFLLSGKREELEEHLRRESEKMITKLVVEAINRIKLIYRDDDLYRKEIAIIVENDFCNVCENKGFYFYKIDSEKNIYEKKECENCKNKLS